MVIRGSVQKTAGELRFFGEQVAAVDPGVGCFFVDLVVFVKDTAQVLFPGDEQIVVGPAERIGNSDRYSVFLGFVGRGVTFFEGPPAAIASGLGGGGAEGNGRELIGANGPSDHVGCHEFGLQGLPVEKFFQQQTTHQSALAMTGDDDGSVVVFVFQVILEGGANIGVGEFKGLSALHRIDGIELLNMSLPITRGEYTGGCIEDAGLIEYGAVICLGIQVGIVKVTVDLPGRLFICMCSRVYIKYIDQGVTRFGAEWFGDTVGGVPFCGMRCPGGHFGVVWTAIRTHRTIFFG